MSGALPPAMRVGSWASNWSLPSYLTVMPVHFSNCDQADSNFCCSGGRIEVKTVTVVPGCEPYCE